MPDPLKASMNTGGQGRWQKDSAGVMLPMGGGSSAKMLMELPKEVRDIAHMANVLVRGNFKSDLWPDLAMLVSLAPNHMKTWIFIANITAGSMAEGGMASIKYLQGIVQMLATSALPVAEGHQTTKARVKKAGDNGKVAQDDE